MNIKYMREYIALVENLNFTNTANKLFISQPSLSRHIAAIEEEIGAKLLVRTKHNVELTVIGKSVCEELKKIVEQYDDFIIRTSILLAGFSGELKIGMLYYCIDEYVTPIVKLFKIVYPNVKLTFVSTQPQQLKQYLLNDEVDVGISVNVDIDINTAELLRFNNLRREKLVAMVSSKNPYAARKSINISELKNETFVFGKQHTDLNNCVMKLLLKNDISKDRFVFTDHIDTIPFAIQETNNVSIVPYHIRNMRRKDIVFINIESEDFFIDMAIAYKVSNNNPAIQLFLEQAKKVFNFIEVKSETND